MQTENKQEIINRTDKPNSISFRYGGTGTDIKLYFNDAEDLKNQLVELESLKTDIKSNIEAIKSHMSD